MKREDIEDKVNVLILGCALLVAVATMCGIWVGEGEPEVPQAVEAPVVASVRTYEASENPAGVWNYGKEFNDSNNVQLPVAMKMGIPMACDDSVAYYLNKGKLVEVGNCGTYYLNEVKYPYLTPEAADLLAQIGKRFKQKTAGDTTRMRVTSCLRTVEHVKKLRRRNANAVDTSCHLFGTTFDISYSRMTIEEKQKLAQVLRDLRDAGYCFVKYERKQPCFHITVRR